MIIASLVKLALFPVLIQYILIATVLVWGYGFAKPNYEQHRAVVQQKAGKRGLLPLHNFDVTDNRTAHSSRDSRDAKRYKEW
jgi:hypothetical protein